MGAENFKGNLSKKKYVSISGRRLYDHFEGGRLSVNNTMPLAIMASSLTIRSFHDFKS